MTEAQVNLDNEKPITVTGTYKNAYYTKSVINYLSGIDKFDKLLDGRKFAQTKYQLIVFNYSAFLSFQFFLENKAVSIFNLSKADVKDIFLLKGQKIEIDTLGNKEEKLGALAGLGGIVGGVTAIATDGLSSLMKKDKLFIKSEEYLNGSIYEIILNDEQNSKITLTTLDANFLENVNAFFSNAFDFNFSGKFELKKEENKNCYIATLCYGDIDAIQVSTFRRYRDNVLSKTIVGKSLIMLYYKLSPAIVKRLAKKEKINRFIRNQILDRIYIKIK